MAYDIDKAEGMCGYEVADAIQALRYKVDALERQAMRGQLAAIQGVARSVISDAADLVLEAGLGRMNRQPEESALE